jgi:hypothetical protein
MSKAILFSRIPTSIINIPRPILSEILLILLPSHGGELGRSGDGHEADIPLLKLFESCPSPLLALVDAVYAHTVGAARNVQPPVPCIANLGRLGVCMSRYRVLVHHVMFYQSMKISG